jgi:hypothetical protein
MLAFILNNWLAIACLAICIIAASFAKARNW